eukprot:CAMPEP_0170169876 /NCGR_PEP_ID=MMETSP0040_2-20121228/2802_1 /TAXON_ID=641309 /ORGANISM="Lotharella oceanica, Strain CCMP622" /LENGTH=106 /DNA_ID=CAMNT_0010408871 /DNA_START=1067 /DNA_END=1384 /DNA_ORIENTATION=-
MIYKPPSVIELPTRLLRPPRTRTDPLLTLALANGRTLSETLLRWADSCACRARVAAAAAAAAAAAYRGAGGTAKMDVEDEIFPFRGRHIPGEKSEEFEDKDRRDQR